MMAVCAVMIIFLVSLAGMAYLIEKVEATTIRVALVGDSITEGSDYPSKLQAALGPYYIVRNFGVSGSAVSIDSSRPYMNQTAFKLAKSFKPEIVVIMLGTNDANPETTPSEDGFEVDYSLLVNEFRQLDGEQLIWVVKSPPIFSNNSAYSNTILSQRVIPQIDTVAKQMSLPTIDVYSLLLSYPEYFSDGVHPNYDGASFIASTVYEAITSPDGSPDKSNFNDGYIG
jgi:lysophospholipase L1-like esterase